MSTLLAINTIYDGPRRAVIQATARAIDNSAPDDLVFATFVDIGEMDPVPESVRVEKITAGVEYGVVELYWAAVPPVRFAVLSGNAVNFDYSQTGPLRMPPEGTGNILISTVGFAPTSTFMIELGLIKRVL
jgi:hypothetical protein